MTETFDMRATPRPFRTALDSSPPERRRLLLETRKRELQDGIDKTLKALKAELEASA